ncbi:MAG: alpha-amylase family glycosyl hydrolase [Rectinemataceae bacterium]
MREILRVTLSAFGESRDSTPHSGDRCMEFHVHASLRSALGVSAPLFRTSGNLIISDYAMARDFAARIRASGLGASAGPGALNAGRLNAMGLIDEMLHLVFRLYREQQAPDALAVAGKTMAASLGRSASESLLSDFTERFPPADVFAGTAAAEDWLASSSSLSESSLSDGSVPESAPVPNRELALEELILLKLANENPAFAPFRFLFDDGIREEAPLPASLAAETDYRKAFEALEKAFKGMPGFGPDGLDLIELLRAPAKACPDSLEGQLRWIVERWGASFGGLDARMRSLLGGLDLIAEEETPRFPPGPGPVVAYEYVSARREYERFSPDRDWMPRVVMIAKSVLVWLHQLSAAYGRPIRRLDEIPESELDILAHRGITALWLIGLWERSRASEKIKRLCGNPEAAASAYSLFDYEIAWELGGWEALDRLRDRCRERGITLAADMVPNHTGMDSAWIRNRPELFMGSDHCPYPGYSYNGPDLSEDPNIGLWLEDHYYDRSDAAVVFKRLDRRTGGVRYIYHGNDGTGMAWNDTAQIDFLNPEAREAVKERILHVARHFGIIRFDAAMVLAKQHIRRLWYPAPGSGGAVPSRAEHAMSDAEFDRAIPEEFWREVVDLCAREAPDTLLLAEAFWMMEGYFVRTLGMHRVYNSAFMNMLKAEKNSMYRKTIRNTQEFDREILKRHVNFMNNPDEETALAQFGSGDKYFGVCTMLLGMPGLPMIGHGQIEGFAEKYGMEYRRAYRNEVPDKAFVARHEREIFPIARMRWLFSGVEQFHLFDFIRDDGHVDENVFAWSNGSGDARALVFYNNAWERTSGHIVHSCPWAEKHGDGSKRLQSRSLIQALDLDPSPGSFAIALEQRSGLRFVFRCSDLRNQGWHAQLEGYQCLVFLDFDRVQDEDGRYERLCVALGGSGIADLDSGLEEASRPELYHAMAETLKALGDCVPALELDEAALETRIEAAGEEGETLFARIALALSEEGGPGPGIGDAAAARTIFDSALHDIAEASKTAAIPASPRAVGAALAYALILALGRLCRKGNPAEELRFVLAKFLVSAKVATFLASIPDAHSIGGQAWGSIVIAFATRPERDFATGTLGRAQELLLWADSDPEAAIALGINRWQGRTFFNKEKMEALLAAAPLFARLEAASGTKTVSEAKIASQAEAAKVATLLQSALPSSEYDLELLMAAIEALARKEKPAPKDSRAGIGAGAAQKKDGKAK